MKKFLDISGKLSVVLGKGHLSLYEITHLKKGDMFIISKQEGEPWSVYYNDHFLCQGEIVVLQNHFGVRISGFINENENINFTPTGIVEDIIEMLPISLQLNQVEVSLKELKNISIGSIIELDKMHKQKKAIELIAAGIPVANGKVVIVGENFGIQIDEVYYSEKSDIPIRSSGNRVDPELSDKKIHIHDYCRPGKFTWESIQKIQDIHNTFIHTLKLLIPKTKKHKTLRVDQWAYCELWDELKKDHSFIIVETEFRPASLGENPRFNHPLDKTKQKWLFQPKNLKNPMSKDLVEKIKFWFLDNNNPRKQIFNKIVIASKNKNFLSKLKTRNSITEFLLAPLKNGWKSIVNINFKLHSCTKNFEEAKVVPEMDMILTVTIGDHNNKDSEFIIIYPYIVIEPILPLIR